MATRIALIGFGEAAQLFAGAGSWAAAARAYDKLTDHSATRAGKLADYSKFGIQGAESAREAVADADLVISLVTAGEAVNAARSVAPHLRPGALYFEMNSVAPDSKRTGAAAVEQTGGRFVDVAIMAPVHPALLDVPLLLSGGAATEGANALKGAGFTNLRMVGSRVGDASAVKMIRSVIVKGAEALTAEAMAAAFEAGVVSEVLSSLDSSEHSTSWSERAEYNLARMMVHGLRRAEEMDEAARTLQSLGVEPRLTHSAAQTQREIGSRALHPGKGLDAKLAQLRPRRPYPACPW
jgi:3-hydroxyisobutyrate dehydrogenase-like beta-hydroxyacid dehydrogenase